LQKRKNRETYLRLRWLGCESCDWINETESTNSKMMPSALLWIKFKTRPKIKKRESERRRFVNRRSFKQETNLFRSETTTIKTSSTLLCSSVHRLKLIFLLIRFGQSICPILLHCSSSFWPLKQRPKRRRLTSSSIKKNRPGLSRVWPGSPGPGLTRRVDRVSPGQLPSGFLPPPGPVPCPGRPGPGSTRRAGPGFKTLIICISLYDSNKCSIFKRASTRNNLETMFWCNMNLIIITTL